WKQLSGLGLIRLDSKSKTFPSLSQLTRLTRHSTWKESKCFHRWKRNRNRHQAADRVHQPAPVEGLVDALGNFGSELHGSTLADKAGDSDRKTTASGVTSML